MSKGKELNQKTGQLGRVK